LSTVFPSVMSTACTTTSAVAPIAYAVPPASAPASRAEFVKVCWSGSPVPFVTGPARAVIVAVPADGVEPAIEPTVQRTIDCAPGITVGAPSDGDDEVETTLNPAGSVSWRTAFWSCATPVFPYVSVQVTSEPAETGPWVDGVFVSAGAGVGAIVTSRQTFAVKPSPKPSP
jgi:hypothetical protein